MLGLSLLVAGIVSAVLIWRAQDLVERQARKQRPESQFTPLAPEDSRRYTHDLEQYYGETGLLTDKLTRWLDELTHGKPLAYTVAVLALFASGGCFLVARISRNE